MNWQTELELAEKSQREWIDRGRKIVKRYRDERGASGYQSSELSATKKYNILWSNVRTMFPAIYAKKPKAQVERRFKDQDPVGRCASEILERALQYEIDHYPDYDAALKGAILDRLLPGRGVAWIRFEASDQITDDAQAPKAMAPSLLGVTEVQLPQAPGKYECTPCDYVFWEDFRHSPARTWEEVSWVARRVYMTKEEGRARFGEAFDEVPLDHEPIGLDDEIAKSGDIPKKGIVWEIWDKGAKQVIWRGQGCAKDLDTKDDPYELDGFFPCPRPLYATLTTDQLIPVPDYAEYQDQAMELDELTTRIGMLVKAVKVVGVYDASQTGVQRMLQEGVDNTLIGVDTWAAFSQAGGLKGVVDFLPLDMVIQALNELYKAREACKQVIYEVTGLADIIRGASVASETATAQQIKSQYASLRLKETQMDLARFATDLLQMKAHIMCEFYSAGTLIEMSGIAMTADKQLALQAVKLLKSGSLRNYRIEIATDSMVELDEQAEKQGRVEFLTAVSGFLKQAVDAAAMEPGLAPLMGEMLLFGVRAFKAGRPLESAIEQFVAQSSQPKAPKPDPEAAKAQADQAQAQAKAQASVEIATIQAQAKAQVAAAQAQAQQQTDMVRQQMEERQHASELQMKARMEEMQAAFDSRQAERDMAFEQWKVEKQAETQIAVAQMTKETTLTAQQNSAADSAARD